MQNLAKSLAILLLAIVAVALAACNNSSDDGRITALEEGCEPRRGPGYARAGRLPQPSERKSPNGCPPWSRLWSGLKPSAIPTRK